IFNRHCPRASTASGLNTLNSSLGKSSVPICRPSDLYVARYRWSVCCQPRVSAVFEKNTRSGEFQYTVMKASRSPRFHASTPPFHTALTSAAGSPTRDGDAAHALISTSSVTDDNLNLLRMVFDLKADLKVRLYALLSTTLSYRRAVDSVLQPLFASSKPSKS